MLFIIIEHELESITEFFPRNRDARRADLINYISIF